MTADRCVVCGAIMPEGGLVCVNCLESNGVRPEDQDDEMGYWDEQASCGLVEGE